MFKENCKNLNQRCRIWKNSKPISKIPSLLHTKNVLNNYLNQIGLIYQDRNLNKVLKRFVVTQSKWRSGISTLPQDLNNISYNFSTNMVSQTQWFHFQNPCKFIQKLSRLINTNKVLYNITTEHRKKTLWKHYKKRKSRNNN